MVCFATFKGSADVCRRDFAIRLEIKMQILMTLNWQLTAKA
jgi:hypothetical protein